MSLHVIRASRAHKRRLPTLDVYARILALSPIAYWPLWETSGTNAGEVVNAAANIVRAAGFEEDSLNTSWINYANQSEGTIAKDAVTVRTGAASLKCTADGDATPWVACYAAQRMTQGVVAGSQCSLSFYTQGDGTNAGRYEVRDVTNSVTIISERTTGVTAASWTQVTNSFTVPATCTEIEIRLFSPNVASGYAYYDDVVITAPAGSGALDGTYSSCTLGVDGIGDGNTAVRLGGTGYVDLWSPGLQNALDLTEGSLFYFYRYKDTDDWAYGASTQQTFVELYQESIAADREGILCEKDVEGANLHHSYYYHTDGRSDPDNTQHIEPIFAPNLAWHCTLFTWSESNARISLYEDRARPATLLAPYTENPDPLGDTIKAYPIVVARLGERLGERRWQGDLAHFALWDRELTAVEARSIG